MRRSILVLLYVFTLSATKLSFAELVPEQWCSKCPPGSDLTLLERDRYDCRVTGSSQSAGAPLWAKPSWAKVVWDAQEGRCPDTYIRFGDEFCYRCPVDYEFGTAVTDYRKQSGKNCERIIGRWKYHTGEIVEFFRYNKWKRTKGSIGTGTWKCNSDGSIELTQDQDAFQNIVTLTISHDGSSFSGQIQGLPTVGATRVK